MTSVQKAKSWLFLSVGSLVIGGLLSLLLVVGRVPFLNQIFDIPLFQKRVLVVHVTLTLGCWFFGYITTLFYLLPGATPKNKRLSLSILGIFIFIIGGFAFSGEPLLSNYIPVIHNTYFLLGYGLFIACIALSLFDKRLFCKLSYNDSLLEHNSILGIKTTALTLLMGIIVLAISVLTTPFTSEHFAYYEIVFWGSGHVFQLANTSALLTVWLILYRQMTGSSLLSSLGTKILFGFQFLVAFLSLFLLKDGTSGPYYYKGFMHIMRWTTWPGATFIILILSYKLFKNSRLKNLFQRHELRALFASAALLLLGFYLGAHIDSSTTLIPGHYHATIGSVTLAFMALTFVLLEKMGYSLKNSKLKPWLARQPLIFGAGQFIFSAGFAYAGAHGLGRKVYGSEQLLKSAEQIWGLGIMGVGGALALLGGFIFLLLFLRFTTYPLPQIARF